MRTLVEQAAAVAKGDVSPVALTEEALREAERVQPRLNAFTVLFPDAAIARAKDLEGRDPVGPLHGVPVAVKDLYDVAGAPTTGCCAPYHDRVAGADSAVVASLVAAGAIVVGKTNQHELACGATTQISSFGPCLNPWGPSRIPGGSSGGSGAAVAAGVVAMAMGSDTGGSIRIPSSFCGVTGLKPTHGAVSLRGAMPMCPSLDTAGPLARSAEDCALVHSVIAGGDPGYLWSRTGEQLALVSLRGLRIGIPRSFTERLHPDTRAAVAAASDTFASLGAVLVEMEGPDITEAFQTFTTRLTEVAHCYRDLWEDERISEQLRGLITIGRSISGPDAFAGRELALDVRREFDRALDVADVLLAPCTAYPAPYAADQEVLLDDGSTLDVHTGGPARLTMPVNVAGLPAVAFPVGFSRDGLPIGAQLIGPDWSEMRLCAVVSEYQGATDWHTRTPA